MLDAKHGERALPYRIVWSSRWGQGEKIVDTAIMAISWIAEFEDKGADAIKVLKDGQLIEQSDLPDLVRAETAASQEKRNADGS